MKVMKTHINILSLIFFSFAGLSQNPNRKFIQHAQNDYGITIQTNEGNYNIQYYTPEIVEISFVPDGGIFVEESHAVVLQPKEFPKEIRSSENAVSVVTEGIAVIVQKN